MKPQGSGLLMEVWSIMMRDHYICHKLPDAPSMMNNVSGERESSACEDISQHNKEWGVKDFKMAFN